METSIESIPGVAEVAHLACRCGGGARVLLEVPHGATRLSDFSTLRDALAGDYPDDLADFFCVNTDVGAPELALAVAGLLHEAEPSAAVTVLRCLVPRTFVDCNRIVDPGAGAGSPSEAGAVTPGLMPWVQDPRDAALLRARHEAWSSLVGRAAETVCGAGGILLSIHTYAPRSIDVPVDRDVIARLRAEYGADRIGRWPLRSEVDLITKDPDGVPLASAALAGAVERELRGRGFEVARNAAYRLHPSTLAHGLARRFPGSTLCIEIRRDLLVRRFAPFEPMAVEEDRVTAVARPLAAGIAASWP